MNKRFLFVLLAVFSITGCGQRSETKFQGVESKRDYITEGKKYLAQKDIQKAIFSFDQAIKQDPANINNFFMLGEIYIKLKSYKRAVDTFSGAVRINPQSGDAYYFMGLAKALDGNPQDAIKDLEKSIDLFVQQRNQDKFKVAVNLLKQITASLKASAAQAKKPVSVEAMPKMAE